MRRGTVRRRSSTLLAALAALGWVWGAARSLGAAELLLDKAAPCVTLDELSFQVERALGKPLAAAEALRLSVRIQAEPAGYGARLEVLRGGERGTRALHAANCQELSEALVVAIAVAIGEEAEAPATLAPAPSAPEVVDSAAAPSAADDAVPEAVPGPVVVGSAWMLGDTGTLPAPGVGAALGVSLEWSRLQLRATGTLLPHREGNLRSASDSPGVRVGLLAGGLVACAPLTSPSQSPSLAACTGWELGQLSGSGTHIATPYRQRALWSAARLEFAARWSLASVLSIELLATALAPFTRDEFILKDLGSVYRPPSVLGRLGVGLGLAFDGGRMPQ